MFHISIDELRTNLHGSSPVTFSYLKADGTIRNALGTLNEGLIPDLMKPKDSSFNAGVNLRYYDLEKEGWRSLTQDCSMITLIE